MAGWQQCARSLGVAVLVCAAVTTAPGGFAAPVLEVRKSGPPTIDPERRYAEITRLEIVLRHGPDHPRAGRVMTAFRGTARVEEWRTDIYDGAFGASSLPRRVSLHGGAGTLELRSLARYTMIAKRRAPVPEIAVYAAGRMRRVEVPQWVDADGDGRIDWLSAQVETILDRAAASGIPAVREVVQAVDGWRQSWRNDCGGVMPDEPTVIHIGAACLDADGFNTHRFDHNRELTATVLHEARHVWAYRHPARARLPRMFNPRPGVRARCDAWSTVGCPATFTLGIGSVQRHEADAEAFAQRYKDRLH